MITQNKKARFDYHIEETFEAGLELHGWEVKSLRAGNAQLTDSYVKILSNEPMLIGCNINPLSTVSTHIEPDPKRTRKLLLHRNEIDKLQGRTQEKGQTLVALDLHWNKTGRAKATIALCSGKKQHDKRAAIKERDWQRDKARILKG